MNELRMQGTLAVSCALKMESESVRFTDELNIYRSYLDRQPGRPRSRSGRRQLMSANCGKIHKYRDNYMEQAGKYTYEGHREPLALPSVLYQLSFTVSSCLTLRTSLHCTPPVK